MNFDRPEIKDFEPSPKIEKIKPTALTERVKKLIRPLFRIETIGLDKLADLPPEKRIIFLPTHFSNYDMSIAIAALADKFPRLKLARASTHEDPKRNLTGYITRQIAGVENCFSLDYVGVRVGEAPGVFNPENFIEIKKALEAGDSIVFAAYYDSDYQNHTWHLPAKGGNGGVYLGQITPEAVLVPVAVDIKSNQPFGMTGPDFGQILKERRPKVEVKIGQPITPEPIPGIERLQEILAKRKEGQKLNPEDLADFSRINQALKSESAKVMAELSEMLPPEKRHQPTA